jgi:hypothetical protein
VHRSILEDQLIGAILSLSRLFGDTEGLFKSMVDASRPRWKETVRSPNTCSNACERMC